MPLYGTEFKPPLALETLHVASVFPKGNVIPKLKLLMLGLFLYKLPSAWGHSIMSVVRDILFVALSQGLFSFRAQLTVEIEGIVLLASAILL